MTIRCLIADDQDLVRAGFKMILNAAPDIEVIGEASNGRDAVTKALHLRPDVCFFDVRMPGLDGIEATRLVAGPDIADPLKVVIVTTFDLDEYVYGALDAGATGFLLKDARPELLIEATRAANQGESLISPSITTRILERVVTSPSPGSARSDVSLTSGEEEVLAEVVRGLTNQEIAAQLHVSLGTAKARVASLKAKLGAQNRIELVILAMKPGGFTTGAASTPPDDRNRKQRTRRRDSESGG